MTRTTKGMCSRAPAARRQRMGQALLSVVGLVFAASMSAPVAASPAARAATKQHSAQTMPNTVVEITAVAPGQLLVEYRLPSGQTSAEFLDQRPEVQRYIRQPMMQALDACGRLETERVVLTSPACRSARFLVTARQLARNAMFEAAQPMSDGSVLAYLRYFGAAAPGAGLTWSLRGPRDGYVLYEGKQSPRREIRLSAEVVKDALARRDTAAGYRDLHASDYAFFGATPVQMRGNTRWIADPKLPAPVRDEIVRVATIAEQALTRASGRPPRQPMTLIMTASFDEGGQRGMQTYRGDVADAHTMRLAFRNPTAAPDEPILSAWREFVAHEFVHVWNSGVFSTDDQQPWLAEGQAEWLSLSLLHEAGLISDDYLRTTLETAYNTCLLEAGDQAWAADTAPWQGRRSYTCGLSFHWVADASAQAGAAQPSSALKRWGAQTRRAPRLDVPAFLAYYTTPAARSFAQTALTGTLPLRDALRRWLDVSGVTFVDTSTPPSPRIAAFATQRVMVPLGEADCTEWGFWPEPQGVRIDPRAKCKHLVPGALVQTIAGAAVPAQAGYAAQAVRTACAAGSTVPLQLDDGRRVDLACPKEEMGRLSFIRLLAPAEPVRATANPGSRS